MLEYFTDEYFACFCYRAVPNEAARCKKREVVLSPMDHSILATWLLLAILALGQGSADASSSSCMPGMRTPGSKLGIGIPNYYFYILGE